MKHRGSEKDSPILVHKGTNMRKIGITTTIPLEVVFASGNIPVDLNNIFITHKDKKRLIREAENDGIPRNFCAWVKGIYSVVKNFKFKEIIIVVQGDCSSTVVLMDIFESEGIKVIPFSYPHDGDISDLRNSINKLMKYFSVKEKDVNDVKFKLDKLREKIKKIDYMTWHDGQVPGFENHYFNVCSSDMRSDIKGFETEIDKFIQTAKKRKANSKKVRLGYVGVPPIVDGLYEYVEDSGAIVVFNEMQRQFSMPKETDNIFDQYANYTYPQSIFKRIDDINSEIKKRNIDGIIHYVQSFCHHQAEHMLLSKHSAKPVLLLECDYPGEIDPRTKMRLESFINMLS